MLFIELSHGVEYWSGVESWSGILESVLEWNNLRLFVVVVHLLKNVNLRNSEFLCSIILLINDV